MIHFMLRENESPLFSFDSKTVLNSFKHINPDILYKKDKDSITWVFDHNTKTLYHALHPEFHAILLNGYWKNTDKSVSQLLDIEPSDGKHVQREDAIDNGFLIGRTGKLKSKVDKQIYPIIAFWNSEFEPDDFDACLETMLKEFPYLIQQKDKIIIISNKSESFEPFFLNDLKLDIDSLSQQPEQPKQLEESSICKQKTSIKVNGVLMELNTFLGKLHNPAGTQELEAMHNAYCGEYPGLKQKFEKDGCKSKLNILNAINTRFKQKKLTCQDNDWKQIKNKGKGERNAELKQMFGNPQTIDQSRALPWFHTQKDINAAWDELKGRHEHIFPSFLEWIRSSKR